MKQVVQNYRGGDLHVEEVPPPALQPRGVLVQNHYSVVSPGTERATLEFARQGWLGKARRRPDLVRQALNKMRTDGVMATLRTIRQRLDTLVPLGYSSAGHVLEVGLEVEDLTHGQLVACGGGGYACHAEVVYVPQNLVVMVPEEVSPQDAAFANLGAIALQGVRRAGLTPGERVAVIGLGLIGQLTVQILRAYGYPVLGLDTNPQRVEQTVSLGLESAVLLEEESVERVTATFTHGVGVDAVIITAATPSNQPVTVAGRISREGGRISAVGDVGMRVPRRLYYEKELDFRLSRSSGPGRYDPDYEERGHDYPIAHVRWTEQRNMEEYLRLVSLGRLEVASLVTHTFPVEQAKEAYHLVLDNPQNEEFTGVLLAYDPAMEHARRVVTPSPAQPRAAAGQVQVGLIGAGSFARGVILPSLRHLKDVSLRAVASATGPSATHTAQKFEAAYATTDYRQVLEDDQVNLVVVATRHNLHSPLAVEALQANRNVHVEKPLALTIEELQRVAEAASHSTGLLMVGFNRRFAPLALRAREHFHGRTTPLLISCRVNAGPVPAQSWIHDPTEGGGRILGEVCHFVDLLHFLTEASPQRIYASRIPPQGNVLPDDNVMVLIDFSDGSRGSILYTALGPEGVAKERIEILGDGKAAFLDNFNFLRLHKGTRSKTLRNRRKDKGHQDQFRAFVHSIQQGKPSPVPLEELLLSSLATLRILHSLEQGRPVEVNLVEVLPKE